MNRTADEMLRLAVLVTEEPHEIIDGNVLRLTGWGQAYPRDQFSPSLTGEDWQKAQAMDVILAVKRLYPRSVWSFDWQEYDGQKAVIYSIGHRDEEVGRGNDLLEASARALLGKEQL